MPRSPDDATRFTATGPHIATKPTSGFSANPTPEGLAAGSRLNIGGAAPHGESPQQKIARLRAAAAASKRGTESGMDTAVRIGRTWADRAHRFTAIGLIGLTVVSGVVATAGITDMMLHNRKRRNEWFAEQKAKSARDLAEARQALASGEANEDQVLLLNRERVAEAAAEAKKNQPGVFKRTTSWLFSGLSTEEKKGGRLGAGVRDSAEGVVESVKSAVAGEETKQGVLSAVQDKVESAKRQGEAVQEKLSPVGGPLDREAQRVADTLSNKSRSWTSWITNR